MNWRSRGSLSDSCKDLPTIENTLIFNLSNSVKIPKSCLVTRPIGMAQRTYTREFIDEETWERFVDPRQSAGKGDDQDESHRGGQSIKNNNWDP